MRGRGSFKRWRKIFIIKSKFDLMSLRFINFFLKLFLWIDFVVIRERKKII